MIAKDFFEPWMKKCNPELIVRFWISKGCPGRLVIPSKRGTPLRFWPTPAGTVCSAWDTFLSTEKERNR